MRNRSRRQFVQSSLTVAGVTVLAGCGIPFGPAAQPARLRRIGYLAPSSPTSSPANLAAFRQGLQELGYVEGRDVALELRFAEGSAGRLRELAAELVGLGVDVIVTVGNPPIRAAQQATDTVPIVFAAAGDPVADGLVASLARPGGNVTGLTANAGEESAKRLELLKQAVPGLSRVAVLWHQSGERNFRETEAAAQRLGVQVLPLELRGSEEIESLLAVASTGRGDGLMVVGWTGIAFLSPRIVELAERHRLPAIYSTTSFVDAGGLMIYAANLPERWRRAAAYVDKILKGAKPADLPVEQPTTFDFVINLKAALALGLTIAQSVLQQATEVIQ